MLSDTAKQIAVKVGHFYLQKHNGDRNAARTELQRLRFSDIKVGDKDIAFSVAADLLEERGFDERVVGHLRKKGEGLDKGVEFTTARPGLFIGRRGENVDLLSKFLDCEIKIKEDRRPYVDGERWNAADWVLTEFNI